MHEESSAVDLEIAALQQELEHLSSSYVPVTALKTKCASMATDRDKFIQLVETTIQYKASNEDKLRELEAQVLGRSEIHSRISTN